MNLELGHRIGLMGLVGSCWRVGCRSCWSLELLGRRMRLRVVRNCCLAAGLVLHSLSLAAGLVVRSWSSVAGLVVRTGFLAVVAKWTRWLTFTTWNHYSYHLSLRRSVLASWLLLSWCSIVGTWGWCCVVCSASLLRRRSILAGRGGEASRLWWQVRAAWHWQFSQNHSHQEGWYDCELFEMESRKTELMIVALFKVLTNIYHTSSHHATDFFFSQTITRQFNFHNSTFAFLFLVFHFSTASRYMMSRLRFLN